LYCLIGRPSRTGERVVLAPHTVNQVDDLVKRAQADGRAPSLIAAVIRDGMIAHVCGAGETPVPGRDLQFRIGSISKTFTAALIVLLRDEGKLSLDDPLERHLPVAGLTDVRIRQLLSQSGGLQREPDGSWWERNAGSSLADLLAGVTDAKRAFGPYQQFHYSNLAYGLLGGVIERLTGEPWWDVVSARLLGPLGLNRTTYQAQEPFARGYVVHPWLHTAHEEPRHDAGAMAPAGQLWSNIEDLAHWAAVLASRQPSVLPAATLAEMCNPVVMADPDAWTSGYGLGLQLWRRGERVYSGHTGSMPGYLAVLATHRRSQTGVVAFANSYSLVGSGIGLLGLSIMDAVLDGETAPPRPPWRPRAAPPPEVEPLCGRWWWMGLEYEVRWEAATSELLMRELRGRGHWRFARDGEDRWRGQTGEQAGEVLVVSRDDFDTPTTLDIATFIFTRAPLSDPSGTDRPAPNR
jgi:CubicO group peptidase (beta-lactamase class C family)